MPVKAKNNKVVTEEYLDKKLEKTFETKLEPYVTKKYLDEKLAEVFDEKLEPYVTKDYLDNKFDKKLAEHTVEIIDVVKEISGRQTDILLSMQQTLEDMKNDSRKSEIRLNDHDVRIEALEKTVN